MSPPAAAPTSPVAAPTAPVAAPQAPPPTAQPVEEAVETEAPVVAPTALPVTAAPAPAPTPIAYATAPTLGDGTPGTPPTPPPPRVTCNPDAALKYSYELEASSQQRLITIEHESGDRDEGGCTNFTKILEWLATKPSGVPEVGAKEGVRCVRVLLQRCLMVVSALAGGGDGGDLG